MIDKSLLTCDPDMLPNHPDIPNPIFTKIGTLYTFQQPGVSIPTHVHTDSNIHVTIVFEGAIQVTFKDKQQRFAKAGDIIDFMPGEEHTITAAMPNTKILNLNKMGLALDSLTPKIMELYNKTHELQNHIEDTKKNILNLQRVQAMTLWEKIKEWFKKKFPFKIQRNAI